MTNILKFLPLNNLRYTSLNCYYLRNDSEVDELFGEFLKMRHTFIFCIFFFLLKFFIVVRTIICRERLSNLETPGETPAFARE